MKVIPKLWKLYESNSKVMYAILGGLARLEFVKVMHCESAKELWDKLKSVYEGDTKVKNAKLHSYRSYTRIDEIVNTMRGLGGKVKYVDIVQEVLRSLHVIFN